MGIYKIYTDTAGSEKGVSDIQTPSLLWPTGTDNFCDLLTRLYYLRYVLAQL